MSIALGTNLPTGLLTPDQMAGYGYQGGWLRFVAYDNSNAYANTVKLAQAGYKLLCVLTKQSLSYVTAEWWAEYYDGLLSAVSIINEPDALPGSVSSDVMSQDELLGYVLDARRAFRTVPLLGPGLCSGNPDWWTDRLNGSVDGLCLHPYLETPDTIGAFLERYRKWDQPLWVTEFGRQNDTGFMAAMFDALSRQPGVPAACCYWPSPAAVAGHVGGQGPMPAFQEGILKWVQAHPAVDCGQPLEDEFYYSKDRSQQMTSTGMFFYSGGNTNAVQFVTRPLA